MKFAKLVKKSNSSIVIWSYFYLSQRTKHQTFHKTSNISQKLQQRFRKFYQEFLVERYQLAASQQIPGYNTSWFLIILNPEEPIPFNQELHELGIPTTQWYYWGSYRNPSKNCVNLCRNFCQNFCQVSNVLSSVKCQMF